MAEKISWNDLEACPRCRNIKRFRRDCPECEGEGFVRIKKRPRTLKEIAEEAINRPDARL